MTADIDPPVSNPAVALDTDIADTIEGYALFRQEFAKSREFFIELAKRKQQPKLLWIGCCDSRVVPSQITSAEPGELFEVRNIANCVPPEGADDDTVGAAIEYALGHLGIDDIVVCGHTGCGGMQALSSAIPPDTEAHLGRWVEYTRPAHVLVKAAGVPEESRMLETIKAHIHFQLDNLTTYKAVREGIKSGRVAIHGWLYDMEHGELLAYDPRTGEWRNLIEMAKS
jgi:carbonic anhydrase